MIEIRDYDVIEEIGRGGMATVYRAMQPSLNRHVALKVLPPHFAHDEEFVVRFRREALAIGKLQHPNIVKVYEFHDDGELFYLAMELIEGGSLSEMIKKADALPLKFTAEVTAQMADALYHAQENGFVHRDIKPGNILLDLDRRAVLTDFGITKAAEGTRLTKTAAFSGGTSEYMSPEQAKGVNVDGRTDLYSLGVVWYEMVTGRCPFERENPFAVIHAQIYDEPPKPSEFNPELDPKVEEIILKLLEKDADNRYQDGLELKAAIEELVLPDYDADDLPIIATSSGEDAKTRIKMPEDEKTRLKSEAAGDLKDEIDEIFTAGELSGAAAEDGAAEQLDDNKATRLKTDPGLVKKDEQKADIEGDKSKELRAESREQIAESRKAESRRQKAEKAKQRAESRERKAESKKQKVKESTAKNKKVKKPVAAVKEKGKVNTEKKERKSKLTLLAAAMTIGLTVMVAGYFMVSTYLGGGGLHHQFKTTVSTLGDAQVTREINIQTDGDSSSYVIALRVKEGKGDIEVRESIPKVLAASVEDIKFETEPTAVIKDDPVVMWRLKPKKEGTTLIYRVRVSNEMITEEFFDKIVKGYDELPKLASIKIAPKIDSISRGQSINLMATGIMSDESSTTKMEHIWKSHNPDVASIDQSGSLVGLKAGNVKITVSSGNVKRSIDVIVVPLLSEIIIEPGEHSLQTARTVLLSATGKYSDGSRKDIAVTWSSSDPGIGSVDASGLFTAISAGKVTVTGRYDGKEAVAIITVTNPAPVRRKSSSPSGGSQTGLPDAGPTGIKDNSMPDTPIIINN